MFDEALRLTWERRYATLIAEPLEGCARLATLHSHAETAARLLGAAAALHDGGGGAREPSYQLLCQQTTDAARAALGDAGFAAAEAAGRALPLEEAVAEALSITTGTTDAPEATIASAVAPYPDSLSAREVEVLGLLAAGHTSRVIAEALVLSVRTVDRHLANIYAKTGAQNRAEAAAYAVRHDLVPPA